MDDGNRHESGLRALAALKQIGVGRRGGERCEICAGEIAPAHPHLIEPDARRIVCCCCACALLFDGNAGARYLRIPQDVIRFKGLRLDSEWEEMSIPIGLAFFFSSSAAGRYIAMYPSPAGAMECALPLESWHEIAKRHPRLEHMKQDVEGLLVNRLTAPGESYLAPIDRCYELIGAVRKHWNGFSGGDRVWEEVRCFFERLDQESTIVEITNA